MSDIIFRAMEKKDINKVFEIERRSFITPWSLNSLAHELKNNIAYYGVATIDSVVRAYAGMWLIFDEAHITNVAVEPEARGFGIGKAMMLHMMNAARERGAAYMTLEVREHNFIAQSMYGVLGFKKEGERRGYYSDTGESAFIMWAALDGEAK